MVSEMSSVDGGTLPSLQCTFKYLLATQFLSRGIPFIFNSWIVRHLSEEDYAVNVVQFHLFVTCILFLSREGFRRACMRADIRCDGASATGANMFAFRNTSYPWGMYICILVARFKLFQSICTCYLD